MRVPFSQLRFPTAPGHAWGVNARRVVYRKNESSWLVLVPKNESGLASRMARARGDRRRSSPGATSSCCPTSRAAPSTSSPPRAGDPWNDGSRYFGGAGLDFRYGLGTGMALVGAVNPDFGQVEVDPAVVNLTAFETFFEEKRPVLHRGQPGLPALRPQRRERLHDLLLPGAAALLLAAHRPRAAGPRRRATSWTRPPPPRSSARRSSSAARGAAGTSACSRRVTGREYARRGDGRVARRRRGRAAHELLRRPRAARARLARVDRLHRHRGRPRPRHAAASRRCSSTARFVGGVDGHVFLDGRSATGSSPAGSPAAPSRAAAASVLRLQRAAQRYYQRPDAPHVSVDPTATSLSGWSGRLGLNKNSGNVTFNAGLWGISPGFEPNDLGYATQTDRGGAHGQVLFRKLTPDAWTRSRRLAVAKWWTFNYGRECQGDGVAVVARARSCATTGSSTSTLGKSWNTWDDKLTRGGPTTIRPGIESLDRRRSRATPAGASGCSAQAAALEPRVRRPQPAVRRRPSTSGPWTALTLLGDAHAPAAPHRRPVPRDRARRDRDRHLRQPLRLRRPRPDRGVDPAAREPRPLAAALAAALHRRRSSRRATTRRSGELAAPRTYDFPVYGVDVGTIARDPERPFYVIDPDGGGRRARPSASRSPTSTSSRCA